MQVKAQHLSLSFGPADPGLLRRLVAEIARSGMNTVVLGLDQGLHYASHPELAAPWAMTRAALREVLDGARAEGLNVIPALSLGSHSEMNFITAAHPEFREPRSSVLCASHPRLQPFLRELLSDVLDLFGPPAVHIGHDELLTSYDPRRRKPVFTCARCRARPAPAVLAEGVTHLRNHLAAQGARTWMWADAFLDPADFAQAAFAQSGCYGGPPDHFEAALDRIPRDIVLCDWHYEPAAEYPTVRHLQDRGFETIGATLFGINGFLFTRYAHQHRTPRFRGMLATAWYGLCKANARSLVRRIREHGFIFNHPGVPPADLPMLPAIRRVCDAAGRPVPRGHFRKVFDFAITGAGVFHSSGWRDLRYVEWPRSHDPVLGPRCPTALVVKPGRAGWIQYTLRAPHGTGFETAALKVWMKCPGRNAISVRSGPAADWHRVMADRVLRGRAVDLTPWVRGASQFQLRFSAESRASGRQVFLKRFELIGCTAAPGGAGAGPSHEPPPARRRSNERKRKTGGRDSAGARRG